MREYMAYLSSSFNMLNTRRKYQGADKSLARPTSRCILFDGENISFDASLAIYINSTNIQNLYSPTNAHVEFIKAN